MAEQSDWMFPENLQPRADALRFDLETALGRPASFRGPPAREGRGASEPVSRSSFFIDLTKKGLTAPDGKIYGSIGQVKTMMLFYRPSVVSKPPATWTELQEIAKKVTTDKLWGYVFSAGGEMDIVYPLRDMIYSQGGRMVELKKQRVTINTPEGKNAWKMLTDMVLTDKSAPTSVVEYSWMSASDMFAMGKAAMVVTHTVDANRFQDPKKAPNIQNDWAVAPPPKWDASKPDEYHASYFDIDGYMTH